MSQALINLTIRPCFTQYGVYFLEVVTTYYTETRFICTLFSIEFQLFSIAMVTKFKISWYVFPRNRRKTLLACSLAPGRAGMFSRAWHG